MMMNLENLSTPLSTLWLAAKVAFYLLLSPINNSNGPAYYDQEHLRHKLTVLT